MKRVMRIAEYDGWKIEASPVILAKQRLFQAGVVIERADGQRFVFSALDDAVFVRDSSGSVFDETQAQFDAGRFQA